MCEAFVNAYAAQINTFNSNSADLQPTAVLFTDTQCGGAVFPETGGAVPSNPFVQGQTLVRGVDFTLVPEALYLPFDFSQVTLTSDGGRSSILLGPLTLPNLSLVNWQQPQGAVNPDMVSDPIKTIVFTTLQPWNSSVFDMCMGETRYVGPYPLSRFYPQSERCDYFMTNQFCSDPVNQANEADACSCITEEPGIEAESQTLGVTLPVICFGPKCATTRSYKTNNMLSQPCNLTICQQIISSNPGIINQGQDTIFCGGQFYKANGTIVAPSVVPDPGLPTTASDGTPFYVWIMLAVSAVLFVVLVVLLFMDRPKKEVSILRQLRKIQSRRQVYNLSNSSTQPVETESATLDLQPFVEY